MCKFEANHRKIHANPNYRDINERSISKVKKPQYTKMNFDNTPEQRNLNICNKGNVKILKIYPHFKKQQLALLTFFLYL